MGLPYPGGPHIDRLAAEGDPKRFKFAKPHIQGLDYSFSGLKTSFLYTLRDGLRANPDFIEQNKADLAASLQATIIAILLDKLDKAVRQTGVRTVAIGGGVSANSGVRAAVADYCSRHGLRHLSPNVNSPPTMPQWWLSPAISNISTNNSAPTSSLLMRELKYNKGLYESLYNYNR